MVPWPHNWIWLTLTCKRKWRINRARLDSDMNSDVAWVTSPLPPLAPVYGIEQARIIATSPPPSHLPLNLIHMAPNFHPSSRKREREREREPDVAIDRSGGRMFTVARLPHCPFLLPVGSSFSPFPPSVHGVFEPCLGRLCLHPN